MPKSEGAVALPRAGEEGQKTEGCIGGGAMKIGSTPNHCRHKLRIVRFNLLGETPCTFKFGIPCVAKPAEPEIGNAFKNVPQ